MPRNKARAWEITRKDCAFKKMEQFGTGPLRNENCRYCENSSQTGEGKNTCGGSKYVYK